MPHVIAKAADGRLVPVGHPDAVSHHEFAGEYRKVTSHAIDRDGYDHRAEDYIPLEFVEAYVARQYSNAHRDTQSGDRAFDRVDVGATHDSGPGGDDQHFVETAPEGTIPLTGQES